MSLSRHAQGLKFDGDRTTREILKFALKYANTNVIHLWYQNFDDVMKRAQRQSKPWLVSFCGDGGGEGHRARRCLLFI